ncbi:hypothetical protein IEM_05811 [Bacillus cereus BAG6O-2]|nr:hypothetical protein IEM_05811 [Bacillus cereus BAG6O-2]
MLLKLKFGKQINFLAIFFTLFTFFGYIGSTFFLARYMGPFSINTVKVSMWIAIILTIIGFRQEKSSWAVIIMGVCFTILFSLYFFLFLDFIADPRS